eukprot:g29737.t1
MGKDLEPKPRGRQLTSFLEELKAKHVTASDLSANERQVHVVRPPTQLRRVIDAGSCIGRSAGEGRPKREI